MKIGREKRRENYIFELIKFRPPGPLHLNTPEESIDSKCRVGEGWSNCTIYTPAWSGLIIQSIGWPGGLRTWTGWRRTWIWIVYPSSVLWYVVGSVLPLLVGYRRLLERDTGLCIELLTNSLFKDIYCWELCGELVHLAAQHPHASLP